MIGDDWTACKERRPPQHIPVMTKMDVWRGCLNVMVLTRKKWTWFKDGCEVYHKPTHWRYLKETER